MSTAPARAAATRPRLGFLGVGWIGRHRMEAVAKSGAAEVAAVADPVGDAAREAAQSAPGCAVAASLDELLALPLDGIVIATPSALHVEQAVRALERGLAVFCQKPLGRTAAEARRAVDAARAADRLLAVDLSYRHVRGVPEVRRLVQEGALGRVHAVNLAFHNAYGPDKAWFYDVRQSGGGCVMDLGIHLVDLSLWVLGFPKVLDVASRVTSKGAPLAGRDAVEDCAQALLLLEGGTAAQLACSWRISAGRACAIEAAFYGTEGGAALRNVDGSFYDFTVERYRGTAREVLATPPDAWGGRAAVAFAEALAAGRGFDAEVEGLVRVAEALDAIYERAR
ncbi:Gfo/Idh/MocA family protein [Anaeromyxobacter sp. Fw109-5]|uniref:Gfo/Idh/MocA family protein n=1 Tax=Anaeromyxobacter sp. (strain Fw109-5) TaxID=404589 RepID=UPI0000ED89DB|nr:Gfo/Idh/MocA family oxidoreductase [Anaeromyxobacter sp. Fw109-5]ABS27414.1 oxidoreductase domain protein [Anaeromyxobacter sp. Fw109-5]